jgi:hypothetical protein
MIRGQSRQAGDVSPKIWLPSTVKVDRGPAAPREPRLVGFDFSPKQVNTSSAPANITLSFHITDNLSGSSGYASATFLSPSGNVAWNGYASALVSGTPLDGVYQGTLSLPAFSEAGTWTVTGVAIYDKAGNQALYSTAQLQTLGFPTTLTVVSQVDTTPPVLVGFDFSPKQVNTSSAPANITLSFHITDNLSGSSGYASATFLSPSGNVAWNGYASALVSGTPLDGVYQGTLSLPAFSEAGTWAVTGVAIYDKAGNQALYSTAQLQTLGFPTTLTNGPVDNIPPTTTATPSPGPNSHGWNNTNVTVNLNSTDNPGGSGVKQIQFALGGAQNTGWQTVAGNAASVTISAEGTTVLSYFATDNAGNQETAKTLTVRIDKTPPVISGLPAPGCSIWPPNHKLVQVATVTAADALSGLAPGSFTVTGTSNDPANGQIVVTGGPNQFNVKQFNVKLGADKDQVYTLTATASDLAGNTITKQATCTVPHDQGN